MAGGIAGCARGGVVRSPRWPRRPGATGERDHTLLSDLDLHLFNEGTHYRLHDRLGAHPGQHEGRQGTWFAVWAPAARRVSVIGDWNAWDPAATPLAPRASSGIWMGFVPGVGEGALYKYHLTGSGPGQVSERADPCAFRFEEPPRTASVVQELSYEWGDRAWMEQRRLRQSHDRPISIYEVHLGSWRRRGDGSFLSYCELAPLLAEHVTRAGFTHVELLPVMEHPFHGSWGYQTLGYFAPTSRHGTPQDFMALVDLLHQHGIGVILDWVPSHFPDDRHGLARLDGTCLYEHEDPQQGLHPDWDTCIFNYGRHEVCSFLISSALYWLERYHADGLRVDAVASMLYLDYSRAEGEWVPNRYGGRENLEAIAFLRQLNTQVYGALPDVQTYAEESTDWPQVTRPVECGGLGFGFKWDMGWMHDTLGHLARDPVHRRYHHRELTFRGLYQFTENFVLPLSHDEVVHGKGSLLGRMPGDDWQRFANLRLLLVNQWTQPGKKLLFMGGEFGQPGEWNHDGELDWWVLEHAPHQGILALVTRLNQLYREILALHELDNDPAGFQWLQADEASLGVLAFLRQGRDQAHDQVAVVLNLTPEVRHDHQLGVPDHGVWLEILNSDAREYGGSGVGNLGRVEAAPVPHQGQPRSLHLTLPPLGALLLRPATGAEAPRG